MGETKLFETLNQLNQSFQKRFTDSKRDSLGLFLPTHQSSLSC